VDNASNVEVTSVVCSLVKVSVILQIIIKQHFITGNTWLHITEKLNIFHSIKASSGEIEVN
jgi:hypothetical protein